MPNGGAKINKKNCLEDATHDVITFEEKNAPLGKGQAV